MKTSLEQFFSGKFLRIPSYQRDYAWLTDNVDDLWDDIGEALRIKVPHYVGTFILARKPAQDVLDVVDGQQRLTTLTMILHALVGKLPIGRERIVCEDRFLSSGERPRLTLLGNNQTFFQQMVAAQASAPVTQGQRRLKDAYGHILHRVDHLAVTAPETLNQWITGIGQLQVLEFVEDNEGNAIRIFETVNDRGRPLSVLEKMKSHLIFASNKYLSGKLDAVLSERFGAIFQAYDAIKEVGGRTGIDVELISQKKFSEDSILRYHFIAYPSDYHDWGYTPQNVLDDFVKEEVKRIVGQDLPAAAAELEGFIDAYTVDLVAFFQALLRLLRQAETQPRYYKLFAVLGLSATLYPLFIRLEMRGMLDVPIAADDDKTLLELIEATDLRVYKTRGTNPERDVARAAMDAATEPAKVIAERLRSFVGWYMNDAHFRAEMGGVVYGENEGLRFVLLEHEISLRLARGDKEPDVPELRRLRTRGMSIEHSLARERTFTLRGRGFKDEQHYTSEIHRLGNLTLLESSLNSAASKKTPEQKAAATDIYQKSEYLSTRAFGVEIQGKTVPFGQADIEARTVSLVDFCANRWSM